MCLQNYEIYSADTLVAVWQDKKLHIVNHALLPLYLQNHADADMWLATRAIDSHRPNSRLLKKALRMTERDDVATVLAVNGVTITDNYWVREAGSPLHYADVCFGSDYFRRQISKSGAKLALTGSPSSFRAVSEKPFSGSAELTNTGSFEKCWKNKDGRWWMYKACNANEAFSEIFISKFCARIGIPCAVYEKDGKYVKTLDFTDGKYNFEPAFSFMGDEEDYALTVDRLSVLCPAAIPDYVRMVFLDAIVFNPDRHTANFGLLRDKETGKILGAAPCFDHNMALIARGYPTGKPKSDLLITLFSDLLRSHPELKKYIPAVSEADIKNAIAETGMRVRKEEIIRFITFRNEMIERE